MRRLLTFLSILLVPTLALAGNYSGVPLVTGPLEPSQMQATINSVINSINTASGGLLFSQPTSVATGTGTSEQILSSYTLPADYLSRTGQTLRIKATFKFAANTNNRTPKLYFGGSSITGTVNATSGGDASLYCDVVKSGTDTQNVICAGTNTAASPALLAQTFTAGTDDDGAGIVIKGTCTDGTSSASDCVLWSMTVESLR